MKRAVIIHGTKGSSQGNWFPDVASRLTKLDYQASVPQFPTPDGQELNNWVSYFEDTVGELDHSSILIGHSIGAAFILRLLERLKQPVLAAVLVAGFTSELGFPEYDQLNTTFISEPFNWQKIRANASHFICISGDNDPYVPAQQGRELAACLGVKPLVINGGGHLNAEFGFITFPQLIEELKKIGVF